MDETLGPRYTNRDRFRIWGDVNADLTEMDWSTSERSSEQDGDLLIERNVPVTLRDGVKILLDLFRPAGVDSMPVLLAWGPYGKHHNMTLPGDGVDDSWTGPYVTFEAPDPSYWTSHGYAVATVDPRGTWGSEGDYIAHEPQEISDCYEVIEWLAEQPWSNGRVGMSGVSYLAETQWLVAARRPPHLRAINPWEGFTDGYRDHAYHGGIPEVKFHKFWWSDLGVSGRAENTVAEAAAHPLFDDYWKGRVAEHDEIEVPAYVVASWSDHGLHTRGTLIGYERIGSSEKWLDVHGTKKWGYFYDPVNVDRLREFFDRHLKDESIEVPDWPKVRLQIRDAPDEFRRIEAPSWPDPRTGTLTVYADAETGQFSASPVDHQSVCRFSPAEDTHVTFDYEFTEDTVILGTMELRLWLEVEGFDDADLFIVCQKYRRDGSKAQYNYFAVREDGELALGWLRVSHRETDGPIWSIDLSHQAEHKLSPGEIVPATVEIWPTGTFFAAGERLRVLVAGRDQISVPEGYPGSGHDFFTEGETVIHTGGRHDSQLVIPTLPIDVAKASRV